MEITSRIQGSHATRFLLLLACLALTSSTALAVGASVKLTTATQPPSGLAGSSNTYATGTGFPTGVAPSDVNVSFALTCMATPLATTTATQVKAILGSTDRVYFNIPSTLKTGTYAVWVTSISTPAFTSSSCSALKVTNTTKTLSACVPSSSIGLDIVGDVVTAYVPNGYWEGGVGGIEAVNIEGGGSPKTISTGTDIVNACSSNAVTGQTVCTANNTDVYLISGTSVTNTLTSGATGSAGFSGGSCKDCGVAIDAADNIAVLEEGDTSSTSGNGFQVLNLATNTFEKPFGLASRTSENISIDPNRNLILSPNEDGVYVLAGIGPGPGYTLSEYDSTFNTDEENDSAAEDCTTGIALSSEEFTNNVFVADLTQWTPTAGTPGSWTAPNSTLNIVSDYGFAAGTCGISVAPGSGHLGVVTGEFGGSTFAVLQLPSKSGSGTPTIADYATTQIPGGTACGGGFSAGYDPHTITAYTSPNTGKAYGVFAGYSSGVPVCVAVVDLQAILSAPRAGGGLDPHDVAVSDIPAGAITYFAIP